jgi:ectoine hydroxylase-related dioxygenase (phytanoyl-CoA dioxygenase family)
MLTAWVPFHDCDEETGTITFVDGSHRWDDVGDLDFFDGRFEDAALAPAGQEIVRVPAVLRRGQVSFHHNRLIHGSGPNRSSRPRRSMAVHLQTGDNRWQDVPPRPGAEAYHRNDELARRVGGRPDYADPRLFPQLWP